jgi:hypothetical protein
LAKNQNTFEKRRREMEKKRKAEDKRARRRRRRDGTEQPAPVDSLSEAGDDPAGNGESPAVG